MRSSLALAGLLLCLSTASDAQEEVAPERIERIKAKMADNLRRLPNYTCTETIERYMRGPRSRIFAPLDTLRLEVALVDGTELFARAGAGKFAEKDIWEIVGDDAAIGNGDFALLASNVFLSQQPVFTQVGETTLNGSPAIRYDYRVARELSSYRIRMHSRQTTVGYHGSFWVQPDTLDLIRLEAHADSISPDLDLAEASHTLEYQPVRIGEADFLLPQVSELAMIDRAGNENRNRTELDSCRQYIAESAIRFVPPVPAAEPRQSPAISVAKRDAAALEAAQKPLPAEILLLARIKARAAENLQRLPNYTCTETIERTRRLHGSRKFQPLDILRLEVALVEGKELFSWPGAGKFEERGIGEIVGHGAAIGNGAFALHAKSIFISRSPNFTYVGNTTLDGRDAIRYDYRVPQMLSGYLMRIGANQAIVGYHGSFWVEPDTLDLIRIEVHADSLPPSLALAESTDTLEYHRARILKSLGRETESAALLQVALARPSLLEPQAWWELHEAR